MHGFSDGGQISRSTSPQKKLFLPTEGFQYRPDETLLKPSLHHLVKTFIFKCVVLVCSFIIVFIVKALKHTHNKTKNHLSQ